MAKAMTVLLGDQRIEEWPEPDPDDEDDHLDEWWAWMTGPFAAAGERMLADPRLVEDEWDGRLLTHAEMDAITYAKRYGWTALAQQWCEAFEDFIQGIDTWQQQQLQNETRRADS